MHTRTAAIAESFGISVRATRSPGIGSDGAVAHCVVATGPRRFWKITLVGITASPHARISQSVPIRQRVQRGRLRGDFRLDRDMDRPPSVTRLVLKSHIAWLVESQWRPNMTSSTFSLAKKVAGVWAALDDNWDRNGPGHRYLCAICSGKFFQLYRLELFNIHEVSWDQADVGPTI